MLFVVPQALVPNPHTPYPYYHSPSPSAYPAYFPAPHAPHSPSYLSPTDDYAAPFAPTDLQTSEARYRRALAELHAAEGARESAARLHQREAAAFDRQLEQLAVQAHAERAQREHALWLHREQEQQFLHAERETLRTQQRRVGRYDSVDPLWLGYPAPTRQRMPAPATHGEKAASLQDILALLYGQQPAPAPTPQTVRTVPDIKGKGKAPAAPVPDTLQARLEQRARLESDKEIKDMLLSLSSGLAPSAAAEKAASPARAPAFAPTVPARTAPPARTASSARNAPPVPRTAPPAPRTPPHAPRTPPTPLSAIDTIHTALRALPTPAPGDAPAAAQYTHALEGLLEQLDGVQSDGDEVVRAARRAAVRVVESALERVERGAAAPAPVDAVHAESSSAPTAPELDNTPSAPAPQDELESSDGDEVVRAARRAAVRVVESALERVERGAAAPAPVDAVHAESSSAPTAPELDNTPSAPAPQDELESVPAQSVETSVADEVAAAAPGVEAPSPADDARVELSAASTPTTPETVNTATSPTPAAQGEDEFALSVAEQPVAPVAGHEAAVADAAVVETRPSPADEVAVAYTPAADVTPAPEAAQDADERAHSAPEPSPSSAVASPPRPRSASPAQSSGSGSPQPELLFDSLAHVQFALPPQRDAHAVTHGDTGDAVLVYGADSSEGSSEGERSADEWSEVDAVDA
ncbi:hypothetical protein FA95DRAFT_1576970 [Auriscalpium vulgare]|uniref:Uncharacterized protein n=1 Tax=Auriscalpium vulgare TaxID=40419 RepID=A0ACB8R8T5_9AGAM|nr:hypothetical protein FA95DRAFT_1576970 [Auriscalpium vulgare]